jgi:hypothetical protein
MSHIPDHTVTVSTSITLHAVRNAANKLAEELPIERLCYFDANELRRAAETIERRLRQAAADPTDI